MPAGPAASISRSRRPRDGFRGRSPSLAQTDADGKAWASGNLEPGALYQQSAAAWSKQTHRGHTGVTGASRNSSGECRPAPGVLDADPKSRPRPHAACLGLRPCWMLPVQTRLHDVALTVPLLVLDHSANRLFQVGARMREKILISLKRNGETVPVTGLVSDLQDGGIILAEESSALPRGFRIMFSPVSGATAELVANVARRRGWPSGGPMKLNVSISDGDIQVDGVAEDALPAGTYEIGLRVNGLRLKRSSGRRISIRNEGTARLTLEEKAPKYRFELNETFSRFDDHTRRILDASPLDGLAASEWLGPRVLHRDRRKACLMNILAKLRVVPSIDRPLSKHVRRIFVVEDNRIYAEVDPPFFTMVSDGRLNENNFLQRDATVHDTHRRLLRRMQLSDQDYDLKSYRENLPAGSLQVIGAAPRGGGTASPEVRFVDIDIDEANPAYDTLRAAIHCGHLLGGHQTDHFKVRKTIARQAANDFLYYRTVEVKR